MTVAEISGNTASLQHLGNWRNRSLPLISCHCSLLAKLCWKPGDKGPWTQAVWVRLVGSRVTESIIERESRRNSRDRKASFIGRGQMEEKVNARPSAIIVVKIMLLQAALNPWQGISPLEAFIQVLLSAWFPQCVRAEGKEGERETRALRKSGSPPQGEALLILQ